MGLKVRYQFAASEQHPELEMFWYDGNLSPSELEGQKVPGSGVLFVGDKGMMIATYGNYTLLPADRYSDFKPPAQTIEASMGHHNEWMHAIRTGGKALCNFDYAGPLTETVLLGTVAHRAGRALKWDGQAMTIAGDDAANAMLTKSYREGWEVSGAVPATVAATR